MVSRWNYYRNRYPYGMTYGGHTAPHLNKPLSDVYPNSYTELRFICPVNIIE